MMPTDPQKGGGMPYYMGALAVAIKWRTQARNAIKGREVLRKLRQEVVALKEEKQKWGLKEEASQSLLKLAHEGREGAEAYARELEQAHAAELAQLTSYQIQNIGVQEAALTSELQRKKLDEMDAAWGQKLGEKENALTAKVEALSLLQAEANKLRVEKEFLEKQLTSKDSRITELEGEVQELIGRWRGRLRRASKRLWPRRPARTRASTFRTATPLTTSSTGRSCPWTWKTEPLSLTRHLQLHT